MGQGSFTKLNGNSIQQQLQVWVREHHQLNGHECEQTPGDSEGQGSLTCCRLWSSRVGHNFATEEQQGYEFLESEGLGSNLSSASYQFEHNLGFICKLRINVSPLQEDHWES